MPRRRRDEDELGAGFPGSVTAAGVIWLVIGVLGTLSFLLQIALTGARLGGAGPGAPVQATAAGASLCCGVVFALAFLWIGYQTVTGKAADVLGNAIGSFVFALIYLGIGVLFAVLPLVGAGPPPFPGVVVVVVLALSAGLGLLFLTAGLLALAGRGRYRAWKRSLRPRRYDDDDDYEDEDDGPAEPRPRA